ncbi:hypothetical protein BCR34DRAFT_582355 [Clohesyomyces aquaticus]|uniref:Uncharacterized protein n=1 Tax=Clohesyomyces aquaticus TaxID=1231657 RepID=A0A1Y2A9H4_9PLEO|nr:hypothetical protein BCR34DRAFT_582355 [Clohesyomyces aquaticus]
MQWHTILPNAVVEILVIRNKVNTIRVKADYSPQNFAKVPTPTEKSVQCLTQSKRVNGKPWVVKQNYFAKYKALLKSLCIYIFARPTPPLRHPTQLEPPLGHHHSDTTTQTPPLRHRHSDTTTLASPSLVYPSPSHPLLAKMKASVAITVLSFLSAASALPISKVTAGIGPQHTERAVLPPFLPKTRPHEKTSTTSSAQLQNTEVYKPSSPYDTRPPKVVIQIIDGVEVKQCESFSATGYVPLVSLVATSSVPAPNPRKRSTTGARVWDTSGAAMASYARLGQRSIGPGLTVRRMFSLTTDMMTKRRRGMALPRDHVAGVPRPKPLLI